MLPTVALPPLTSSTVQVTAVFVEPVIVAVKERAAELARVVVPGLRDTWTGARTVTTADATLLASATLVALMVWVPAKTGAV